MALRGRQPPSWIDQNLRLTGDPTTDRVLVAILATLGAILCIGIAVVFLTDLYSSTHPPGSSPYQEPIRPSSPSFTPAPARQPQWSELIRWTGSARKNTETFRVGRDWAIEWVTRPDDHASNFVIWLCTRERGEIDLVANTIGEERERSMQYTPGEFYLKIETGQPYTIIIWEKQ